MTLRDATQAQVSAEAGIIPISGEIFRNASGMEAVFTSFAEEHIQIVPSPVVMSTLVQVHGINEIQIGRVIPHVF